MNMSRVSSGNCRRLLRSAKLIQEALELAVPGIVRNRNTDGSARGLKVSNGVALVRPRQILVRRGETIGGIPIETLIAQRPGVSGPSFLENAHQLRRLTQVGSRTEEGRPFRGGIRRFPGVQRNRVVHVREVRGRDLVA